MFTNRSSAVYLFLALYYLGCWLNVVPYHYAPIFVAYLALSRAH